MKSIKINFKKIITEKSKRKKHKTLWISIIIHSALGVGEQ
jgi:hypothetical protein